jgi:hypothetical protein
MRFGEFMRRGIFLLLLCFAAFAQDISVKSSLADLIESAVKSVGVSINIPPADMTETSINISTINGINVCDPSVKTEVIALQNEFSKSTDLRLTVSIYGVYTKSREGELKFSSGDSLEIKKLVGECKYLYVSVW